MAPEQALSQSLSQLLQEIKFLSEVGQGGSSKCLFTEASSYENTGFSLDTDCISISRSKEGREFYPIKLNHTHSHM